MSSPKKAPAPPVIPADLPLLEGPEAAHQLYTLAAGEDEALGLHIKNADLTGEALQALSAARCVFEGCRFAAARLDKASFVDCRFVRCDFSGAYLLGSYFSRCEITGCKLLGANLAESSLREIKASQSLLRLSVWDAAKWTNTHWQDCDLGGAMLTGMTLKQPVFDRCDLRGACVNGTALKGVDLRGCALEDLSAGETLREVRGAIVDEMGAVALAALLGIKIQ